MTDLGRSGPFDLPMPAGPDLSRRDLLRYLAYGTAGVALLDATGCSSDSAKSNDASTSEKASSRQRTLVVVELNGGNDGLSTLVPYELGRYHDLRPTLALGGDDVIDWGDGRGVNRALADLEGRGLAIIEGVGSVDSELSHFEMLDRWWRGLPAGGGATPEGVVASGFLGRLCDALQGEEHFTGVSMRFGTPLAIRSLKAGTTGLAAADSSVLSRDAVINEDLHRTLQAFSTGADTSVLGMARSGLERTLWILEMVAGLPAPSTGYPDHEFGDAMAVASRLVRSDAGVRVLHVPFAGGPFDTHANHVETHARLMDELNGGVAAFLKDMRDAGLDDQVLVATTSEFGRRPKENLGGVDHGTASAMMLLGPVVPGLHGEPSSLDTFDENDNLVPTVSFDRYYATLAHWMQVDADAVLERTADGYPEPIAGVLAS